MGRLVATLAAALSCALAAAPTALGAGTGTGAGSLGAGGLGPIGTPPALTRALSAGMHAAGAYSGAEVTDLTTGTILYSHNAEVPRLPASVEKLWTTSALLARFGPAATLTTSLQSASTVALGTLTGPLYLRGGGDPTFGSAAFDAQAYGMGATVEKLVAQLKATGVQRITGPIVADGSYFDDRQGTPATGYKPSVFVEGALGGLTFNRDWSDSTGSSYYPDPALEAGEQLALALKAAGIRGPKKIVIRDGTTPSSARPLAAVASPSMAQLVALTNTPSDDFFAETLLKDLGARYGTGGTTAAGAAVVRDQIAQSFGLHPRLNDGSGLSRYDRTTPSQVISLLTQQHTNSSFTNSLAIAGETGTLVDEMNHTVAQGRCRGKTGTLHDVSNLVGYCTAADGHTLAFAILMNGVNPYAAHPIQDHMVEAIARSQG
jgi:D-alanyl-D-alanine carboxypeptidase/D-alanyl-D-alanine-endopeptidase (penicillin-binding protein 4)